MTAMTAATLDQLSDGRMLLGIGSSRPAGRPRAGTACASARQLQRTREYVEVVRMALARERVEYHGETLELPLPDGPGKALKLTIAPGAGADPDLPRGDRAEEHRAGRRDRRRLDPDAVLPRARRRAAPRRSRRARRGPGARSTASTSRPTVNVFITDDLDGARDAMRPFLALYVGGMGSREQELLQPARAALRVRGRRARGPGPLPGGQARTRRRRRSPTS